MLKPYNRQQIQTDKMLSDIGDTHYREMLTQILTHEDTLYNVIPSTKYNTITNMKRDTLLGDIITTTDSVVIAVYSVLEPVILDKYGGYMLNTAERTFVGTEFFTIYGTKYIIETNYKSIHDVYIRLYMEYLRH